VQRLADPAVWIATHRHLVNAGEIETIAARAGGSESDKRAAVSAILKVARARGLKRAEELLLKDRRGRRCAERLSFMQDEIIRLLFELAERPQILQLWSREDYLLKRCQSPKRFQRARVRRPQDKPFELGPGGDEPEMDLGSPEQVESPQLRQMRQRSQIEVRPRVSAQGAKATEPGDEGEVGQSLTGRVPKVKAFE